SVPTNKQKKKKKPDKGKKMTSVPNPLDKKKVVKGNDLKSGSRLGTSAATKRSVMKPPGSEQRPLKPMQGHGLVKKKPELDKPTVGAKVDLSKLKKKPNAVVPHAAPSSLQKSSDIQLSSEIQHSLQSLRMSDRQKLEKEIKEQLLLVQQGARDKELAELRKSYVEKQNELSRAQDKLEEEKRKLHEEWINFKSKLLIDKKKLREEKQRLEKAKKYQKAHQRKRSFELMEIPTKSTRKQERKKRRFHKMQSCLGVNADVEMQMNMDMGMGMGMGMDMDMSMDMGMDMDAITGAETQTENQSNKKNVNKQKSNNEHEN
ncbi:TiTiN family member (ttn-1), partial [Reticulomyxa filosa]